jgi:hypothetical protein
VASSLPLLSIKVLSTLNTRLEFWNKFTTEFGYGPSTKENSVLLQKPDNDVNVSYYVGRLFSLTMLLVGVFRKINNNYVSYYLFCKNAFMHFIYNVCLQ